MAVNDRELLIENKTSGLDPLVDKILSSEDNPEKSLFAKAKYLHSKQVQAMYIEACLLATNDLNRISEIIDIDVETLDVYRKVYYDLTGANKLDKMELLSVKDRNEYLLKLWALNQGIEFIAWRLGGRTTVDPVEGLKELFSTSMYKAKEACFSGNATEESKEATKWTKLSMDLARLLRAYSTDGNQAKNDLDLALREVIPEFQGFESLDDLKSE